MTWRTPDGERVLSGAHAKLLRQSLAYLRDCIATDLGYPGGSGWSTGVKAYDQLTPQTRLAMLATVATALFRETPKCPPLNILTEGTVGALYHTLNDLVGMELVHDDPEETTVRAMILNALHQQDRESLKGQGDADGGDRSDSAEEDSDGEDDQSGMIQLYCEDPDDWDDMINLLSECVLWDCDFLNSEKYVDAPPVEDSDYFRVQSPKPSDDQIPALLETIDSIVGKDQFVMRQQEAELRYIHTRLIGLLRAVKKHDPPEEVAHEIESILQVVQWPEDPKV